MSDKATIIISGPSGVGKNAIISKLENKGQCFRFITPITSRPIRETEIVGYDYEFVTKNTFRELIKANALFEWDYTLDNYYGFRSYAFDPHKEKINITHALAKMALRIKAKRKLVVTVFLDPVSNLVVQDRLIGRDGQGDLDNRIKHGIDEKAHMEIFDYVIKGNNIHDFVSEIMNLIQDNKCFNSDWLRRCAPPPPAG